MGGDKAVFVYIGAAQEPPAAGSPATAILPPPARFTQVRVTGPGSTQNDVNLDEPCPIVTDCEAGAWGNYSECTMPCNGGQQTRRRAQIVAAAHQGTACTDMEQTRPCNTQSCDCEVSQWSAFGGCSMTCALTAATGRRMKPRRGAETGKQVRARNVTNEPRADGLACPELEEARPCNDGIPCANVGLPPLGQSDVSIEAAPRTMAR